MYFTVTITKNGSNVESDLGNFYLSIVNYGIKSYTQWAINQYDIKIDKEFEMYAKLTRDVKGAELKDCKIDIDNKGNSIVIKIYDITREFKDRDDASDFFDKTISAHFSNPVAYAVGGLISRLYSDLTKYLFYFREYASRVAVSKAVAHKTDMKKEEKLFYDLTKIGFPDLVKLAKNYRKRDKLADFCIEFATKLVLEKGYTKDKYIKEIDQNNFYSGKCDFKELVKFVNTNSDIELLDVDFASIIK